MPARENMHSKCGAAYVREMEAENTTYIDDVGGLGELCSILVVGTSRFSFVRL